MTNPDIDYKYWSNLDRWTLVQAVRLLVGANPDLPRDGRYEVKFKRVYSRFMKARNLAHAIQNQSDEEIQKALGARLASVGVGTSKNHRLEPPNPWLIKWESCTEGGPIQYIPVHFTYWCISEGFGPPNPLIDCFLHHEPSIPEQYIHSFETQYIQSSKEIAQEEMRRLDKDISKSDYVQRRRNINSLINELTKKEGALAKITNAIISSQGERPVDRQSDYKYVFRQNESGTWDIHFRDKVKNLPKRKGFYYIQVLLMLWQSIQRPAVIDR